MSAPIDTPHHQPHSPARSLRSNGLGLKGAAALAEGLKGNSTLQSLKFATRLSNCLPSVRLRVSARYTAVFTASRLRGNSIGGVFTEEDEFIEDTKGIIALCGELKGSSVTSLECTANPKCSPLCQRPLTLLLPWQLG